MGQPPAWQPLPASGVPPLVLEAPLVAPVPVVVPVPLVVSAVVACPPVVVTLLPVVDPVVAVTLAPEVLALVPLLAAALVEMPVALTLDVVLFALPVAAPTFPPPQAKSRQLAAIPHRVVDMSTLVRRHRPGCLARLIPPLLSVVLSCG